MKRRFWIAGLLLALLTVGGYFFWNGLPGRTPPGQPLLVEITSAALDSMKAEFNRESDSVRVIVLLSPT